ncbi:sigma-70 family RNA polymerase sigma factor [Dactylosporangium vinaceum]|uniref:Sigma-70 family RNA polymerase sigma factor n=1 Tax=Dactylosporangium vinaceum TaxID=53362 RepID=A0ABV5MS95_9ACTN|nr:sigma-70 family RNA polymerase sigma factor [Dactylosporangium vinaceum]UAC00189.1 sigma-70 family RNA polymerase sigma factor [Dactylosporangium vinaceum]
MRADTPSYVDYVSARLPALHRAAFLLCAGDTHRADDIVQATITRLYQHWKRAARSENLDAYVHRMLVHALVDERRSPWARVRLTGRSDERADESGPYGEAPYRAGPYRGGPYGDAPQQQVDERSGLVAALRRLPPRQRAILVMRFLLDRSIEEVAEALGCSTGTVKSQSSRGLEALRGMLSSAKEH